MPDEPSIPLGLCQCGCGQRTKLAPHDRPSRGWTKGEPMRYVANHGRRQPFNWTVEDHGYATPCWIWQGEITSSGYGRMKIEGRRVPVHRWLYERHVRPIPEKRDLDHLCRVTACVNPTHLEPVTHAENIRRGKSGRLSNADVFLIRFAAMSTSLPQHAIGEMWGVTQQYVCDLMRGKNAPLSRT